MLLNIIAFLLGLILGKFINKRVIDLYNGLVQTLIFLWIHIYTFFKTGHSVKKEVELHDKKMREMFPEQFKK